jgi:hypothetical protein
MRPFGMEEHLLKLKRDPNTGLFVNFPYSFKDDGTIDYKKLIPARFLYVPKDKEQDVVEKYGKSIDKLDLREVEDRYLAILLGGLRYLLNLRGYKSVVNKVDNVSYDASYQMVSACTHTCTIEFIGNYETSMQSVTYSDSAGASVSSVSKFLLPYIETASANRALCRAIRGFLGLSIVSKEELAENAPIISITKNSNENSLENNSSSSGVLLPRDRLRETLKSQDIKFDLFKKTVINHYKDKITGNPEEWESIEDIKNEDVFEILGILKDNKKKKK